MSDKEKNKPAPASAEATPDTETPEKPSPKAKDEAKPVDPKPAKTEIKADPVPPTTAPSAPRPSRTGIFSRRSGDSGESKADLYALAEITGTNSIILAALKSAYCWTDRTRLTRAEFLEKRDAWLKRPAKEA